MRAEIDGLIDGVADVAVSTAIAIDTGEVTLEDGQAHLKKMIDSGKHQVHALVTAEIIAELERLDDQWRGMLPHRLSRAGIPAIPADLITDRIKELKAKETQL